VKEVEEVELKELLKIVTNIKKSDKNNVLLEIIAKDESGKVEPPMYFYVFSKTKDDNDNGENKKACKEYYIHSYSTSMNDKEIADWLLDYKTFKVREFNENVESDYYKIKNFYLLDKVLSLVLAKYKQQLKLKTK